MKKIHQRITAYILAGVIGTACLAGCSAASSFSMMDTSNGAMSSSAASYAPAPQAAAGEWGMAYDEKDAIMEEEPQELETENLSTSASAITSQPRKIIRNADLALETMEYEPALEKIPDLAGQAGGYVESSSSDGISLYNRNSSRPARRSAYFTVRVPAENLDAFIASLAQEFNMLNKSESSADISDRYYDTQARLDNLQIQEKRLLELLEQAGKLADLLEIEKELADVRYQIETLTATMKRMDSQVSYSTVNISLEEVVEYQEVSSPPRTFGDRLSGTFKDSWRNFLDVCESILFTVIYCAPMVLLLAVVVVVIVLIVRGVKRHSRRRKSIAPDVQAWTPEENKQDSEPEDK